MSTAILKNRHRRDELLARADLDFLCVLAAHRTAVLAFAHARSGFCGDALADPDIEAAVVVENQVDGRSAVGEVGDDGRVGEGEDRDEGQEEKGEDVHGGEILGLTRGCADVFCLTLVGVGEEKIVLGGGSLLPERYSPSFER